MTAFRCPRCEFTLTIRWASGTPHCPRCGPPWQPLEPVAAPRPGDKFKWDDAPTFGVCTVHTVGNNGNVLWTGAETAGGFAHAVVSATEFALHAIPQPAIHCPVWTQDAPLGWACGNPLPCPDHPEEPT